MTNIITRWNFDITKVSQESICIEIPGLGEDFHEYKIIQLSDFHLGTMLNQSDLRQIIEQVNILEPDLVAITGDLVSSNLEIFAQIFIDELSKISAVDGVVSVMGNHDHWTDVTIVREIYRECQILELRNQTHSIQRNDSELILAGIDDYYAKKDDLEKVVSELPDDKPVVLLAHEPDFAEFSSQSKKFVLQLSGHSHGGQICFPGIGSLYLPRYARKYPSGLYSINGMTLYTNRGLGTSWLKIRFNCSPEIAVFRLQSPNC
jgi:predicted MPP superfamily phosphohydrolase